MGKTFKRNESFRPKKNGKVFTKDQDWKRGKKRGKKEWTNLSDDVPLENFGS